MIREYYEYDEDVICPFCKEETHPINTEPGREIFPCNHLLYVRTSEGGFEFINEDYDLKHPINESSEDDEFAGDSTTEGIMYILEPPFSTSFTATYAFSKEEY